MGQLPKVTITHWVHPEAIEYLSQSYEVIANSIGNTLARKEQHQNQNVIQVGCFYSRRQFHNGSFMTQLGHTLMAGLALSLGLEESYFASRFCLRNNHL